MYVLGGQGGEKGGETDSVCVHFVRGAGAGGGDTDSVYTCTL